MSLHEPQIEIIQNMSNAAMVKTQYSVEKINVPWHKHNEIEMVYVIDGNGMLVVGETIDTFEKGNLIIFGSNVPHLFKSNDNSNNTHIVIQFNSKLLNEDLLSLNEMSKISKLYQSFDFGIKVANAEKLYNELHAIVESEQFEALMLLYRLLNKISNSETHILSPIPCSSNKSENSRIGKIYQYVLNNYDKDISIESVAKMLNLSKPAFCNYFKKKINKRFSEFVNELRINKACVMLSETELTISEICYKTGFSNLSYFNRSFYKQKGTSPVKYRKEINS